MFGLLLNLFIDLWKLVVSNTDIKSVRLTSLKIVVFFHALCDACSTHRLAPDEVFAGAKHKCVMCNSYHCQLILIKHLFALFGFVSNYHVHFWHL